MIAEVVEHSLLLVMGGIVYGLCLYNLLPLLGVSIRARDLVVLFVSVSILFWVTFLVPRTIIFSDILSVDIVTYIGISSFSYLVFLAGFAVSIVLIAWYRRLRHPPA